VFLSRRLRRLSRSRIQVIIERGRCVLEGGRRIRPSTRLSPGDVLVITREVKDTRDLPERFEVLYEDDRLYIVDKPAGMPVHPTTCYSSRTLVTLARRLLPGCDPRLCHRLDRETSGIVVMAKDVRTQRRVMLEFEKRRVVKTYLALVWGRPDPPSGAIDVPIRLSRVSRIRMKMETVAETDHGTGLASRTLYETVSTSRRFSLVSCTPETGRQHQIRVHLSHAGHPVVGDKIYGVAEDVFLDFVDSGLSNSMLDRLLLPRHALHASRISLRHPSTGERITVDSPLADDIRDLFDSDR